MPRYRHYFSFGQIHTTTFPLPREGRLADYWVTVDLPMQHGNLHRIIFMDLFMKRYCPSPHQFAFEYDDSDFDPKWFPKGELCVVTEEGIQGEKP